MSNLFKYDDHSPWLTRRSQVYTSTGVCTPMYVTARDKRGMYEAENNCFAYRQTRPARIVSRASPLDSKVDLIGLESGLGLL